MTYDASKDPQNPNQASVVYTPEEIAAAGLAPIQSQPAPAQKPIQQPVQIPSIPSRQTVAVRSGTEIRPLIPTTIDEVYRFARMMALTYNLPQAYYDAPKKEIVGERPYDQLEVATMRAIHAMQIGAEVGIPPAQAIQSILVLNGVGTIWGDAQLGLVLASGKAKYVKEYTDGGELWEKINAENKSKNIPNRAYTWICETHRVGFPDPVITKFSVADAIHSGIWGKNVWATHPERMGKYKARSFGLRDNYADVLKGLCHSREEMEGELINATPNGSEVTPVWNADDAKLLAGKEVIAA